MVSTWDSLGIPSDITLQHDNCPTCRQLLLKRSPGTRQATPTAPSPRQHAAFPQQTINGLPDIGLFSSIGQDSLWSVLKLTLHSSRFPPGGRVEACLLQHTLIHSSSTSSLTLLPWCKRFPHAPAFLFESQCPILEVKKTEHWLLLVLFIPFITFLLLGTV